MSRRHGRAEVLMSNPEDYANERVEDHLTVSPEEYAEAAEIRGAEPPHNSSLTDVAAEAMRLGLYPPGQSDQFQSGDEVPGEDDILRVGDPDVDPLSNEFSGEESPGGSSPSPDQNDVDDIGRIYGVTDEGNGALVSAEELVERRDAHRWDAEALSPKI